MREVWCEMSKVEGVELREWVCDCAYSEAVCWRRVESQCEEGILPCDVGWGKGRGWGDWMRTVVRQVSVQEVPGTWPVRGGGVMVIV